MKIFWRLSVLFITVIGPTLSSNSTVSCGGQSTCAGNRPKLENGCCPRLQGEPCAEESADALCDSDLGYNCTDGVCKGKFGLQVRNVGETTVHLSWHPFLTSPRQYEYSVLYTTDISLSLLQWNSHGVENRTEVTLHDLVPDTWYFCRIGIWIAGNYSNLTEIAIFSTKAKDYCLYDGRQIAVGDKLVVEQCEESCICRPNGTFQCVPICRKHDVETPTCDEFYIEPYCCDVRHQCSYDNCTYLGENVQHESSWVIDCAENCTCYDGVITCAPHCRDPVKPKDCAVEPVLGKSADGCCDAWECREPDNVCYYENQTILPGTIFFHGNCQLCTCSEDFRDTKCIDFHRCGTTHLPVKSPVCPDPVVLENVCCDQVVCQNINSELDDVIEIWTVSKFSLSSVLVRFQLISEADEKDVEQVIFFYTNRTDVELPLWMNFTFNLSDAHNIINSSHLFTDFGAKDILYKIDKSFFFVVPYLDVNLFYYLVMSIQFSSDFKSKPGFAGNSTNTSTLWSDTIATKLADNSFTTPTTLSRSAPMGETMSFIAENTSSTSAYLKWTVPSSFKYKIASYVIKYKPLSAKSWFYTKRLIFTETNFMLTCLFHTKWYEAHLLSIPGERRLGTTFFNTLSVTETANERYLVDVYDIKIGMTSASLHWFRFQDDVLATIFNMEVLWSRVQKDGDIYKYCLDKDLDTYTVDGLQPGTMYTVWVAVNLRSGQTVFSHRLHFVTSSFQVASSHSTNNHSIIVAITVSCISLFTMVTAIATICYITRCKRRMQYEAHNAFENRIFQIYSNREEPEL